MTAIIINVILVVNTNYLMLSIYMPYPIKKMSRMPMFMQKKSMSKVKKPLPSIYDSIAGTKKTLEQMQVQITKIAKMVTASSKKDKKC